jgi:hypothetical protein
MSLCICLPIHLAMCFNSSVIRKGYRNIDGILDNLRIRQSFEIPVGCVSGHAQVVVHSLLLNAVLLILILRK